MVIAVIVAALIKLIGSRETYPELMKVLNQSNAEEVVGLLGNDYEIITLPIATSYIFNDYELDGVTYEMVYVTELFNGELYEIGAKFNVDDLSELKKYAKDISKYFGKYEKREGDTDAYRWKTAKSLNPGIWIHGNSSPYQIMIILD